MITGSFLCLCKRILFLIDKSPFIGEVYIVPENGKVEEASGRPSLVDIAKDSVLGFSDSKGQMHQVNQVLLTVTLAMMVVFVPK